MVFGITGNITKPQIWEPLRHLVTRFQTNDTPFIVSAAIAPGLSDFELGDSQIADGDRLATSSDVVLSFGGDGTLLNTVFELGAETRPILGVNVGRLGFLASTEVQTIDEAIDCILAGDYSIDRRAMLQVRERSSTIDQVAFALNELVIMRSGVAGLITLDVDFNDEFLNAYWADGLVIATPTGSTAYSLSAGGPILSPGCGSIVVTPIAAHSLGERPIVLPNTGTLRIRIVHDPVHCVYALDGRSRFIADSSTVLEVSRAARDVELVRLPGHTFSETLRRKLKWGSEKERT